MKVVIVAEGIKERVASQEEFDNFIFSVDIQNSLCILDHMPDQEYLNLLKLKGIKLFCLEELLRQAILFTPPVFSDIVTRQEASVNEEILSNFYNDQVVFVTGGEGFIGAAIVESLLSISVKKVIVYGHGENSASWLCNKYIEDDRFTFVLGDIRDSNKLNTVLQQYKPKTIFHAAAYKHVSILDMYPEEAIKTNILGTVNTINAANAAGVGHFVLVSTDKAVNSASALGASKRIAEKICLSMNAVISSMHITTVRFGNVFGSIGSVVPIFLEQIAKKAPLTITDYEMCRYFMSVQEAVRLVLLAATMENGSLFSFDMGDPICIKYLAQKLVEYAGFVFDETFIRIIGNRGGEKTVEELIHSFETVLESTHEKLITLQDTNVCWNQQDLKDLCKELEHVSSYGTREEIIQLLQRYVG